MSESFFENLLERVPELAPVVEEHVAFNKEILSHLLMGDTSRFALQRMRESGPNDVPLNRLLLYLEEQYSLGDEYIQELISGSFLENIAWPESDSVDISGLLGPNLREQLRIIIEWRP